MSPDLASKALKSKQTVDFNVAAGGLQVADDAASQSLVVGVANKGISAANENNLALDNGVGMQQSSNLVKGADGGLGKAENTMDFNQQGAEEINVHAGVLQGINGFLFFNLSFFSGYLEVSVCRLGDPNRRDLGAAYPNS